MSVFYVLLHPADILHPFDKILQKDFLQPFVKGPLSHLIGMLHILWNVFFRCDCEPKSFEKFDEHFLFALLHEIPDNCETFATEMMFDETQHLQEPDTPEVSSFYFLSEID